MKAPQFEMTSIQGADGNTRINVITPDNSRNEIALVLPGSNYSCSEPLLYFAIQILLNLTACALDRNLVSPSKIVWQCPALFTKWATMKECSARSFAILGRADPSFNQALAHLP